MSAKSDYTDNLILYFVRESPKSGYNVLQFMKDPRVNRWCRVTVATIYNSLKRLHEKGYVTEESAKEGNYPEKKMYEVTAEGIAFNDECLRAYLRDDSLHSEAFTIGISCSSYLSAKEIKDALRDRVKSLKKQRKADMKTLDDYPTLPGLKFPEWIHLDREVHLLETEIEWTQNFIKNYKTPPKTEHRDLV